MSVIGFSIMSRLTINLQSVTKSVCPAGRPSCCRMRRMQIDPSAKPQARNVSPSQNKSNLLCLFLSQRRYSLENGVTFFQAFQERWVIQALPTQTLCNGLSPSFPSYLSNSHSDSINATSYQRRKEYLSCSWRDYPLPDTSCTYLRRIIEPMRLPRASMDPSTRGGGSIPN